MKISFSPYELKPRQSLSHRATSGTRRGALLRVEWKSDVAGAIVGYADLHPWPELGDAFLREQLDQLRSGRITPLTRNALQFASIDAEARAQGISLGQGLSVPESHFLVTEFLEMGARDAALEHAIEDGYRVVKLKTGRDPIAESRAIRALAERFESLRFRLDFNGALDARGLAEFENALGPALDRIDLIEDPTAWDPARGFAPSRARLALDREVESASAETAPAVLVYKPAVNRPDVVDRAREWGRRLVVTSYLDHPFGQVCAAWRAAKIAARNGGETPDLLDVCGLASHFAYEMNEFSECLEMDGPVLRLPEGTGFGFDDLLERQDWRELVPGPVSARDRRL